MQRDIRENFLRQLKLFAAFDYEHPDGTTHWCIRHELPGGDTECVAEIPDTAAWSILGMDQDTPQDWWLRELLAEMMAAGPQLYLIARDCRYGNPEALKALRDLFDKLGA